MSEVLLLECSRLNAKNRVQAEEENLVVNNVKIGRKIQQRRTEMIFLSRAERISFTIHNKTVQCCVLLDRLSERDY